MNQHRKPMAAHASCVPLRHPETAAFTLIELSIVLVIIGLIVGGILTGRDLIRSAELQTIITDKNKYTTAVNTFRTKYNELPGDMTDATTYWGAQTGNASDNYTASCYGSVLASTAPATCNGNGNGIIANTADCTSRFWSQVFCSPEYPEGWYFWKDLANAGMIGGAFSVWPTSGTSYEVVGINVAASRANANAGFSLSYFCPTGDGTAFQPFACGHIFFYGGQTPTGSENWTDLNMYPTLTALDAQRIDAKIDDGIPGTGTVTALSNGSPFTPNCTTTAVTSTAAYAIATSGPQCSLMFNAGF
jgi:prepilin-type N-terminal cleavage/methylation domain-containing protein